MTYLDRPAGSRGGAWAHNTLGAVVHNVLRAFFALPGGQRTPEEAARLLRRYWKSDGFAGPEQAETYRARAEQWLSEYVSGLDADFVPLAVEQWVSAPIGTIIAEGRVDRIDQRAGNLVVVDYKTGRHGVTVDDARDSLALALYALASGRTLRRSCRQVELHHVPTGRVVSWEHTDESFAAHLERAERLAGEIQSAVAQWETGADPDEVFGPQSGRHCSACDFRAHCPEGQRAAPEVSSWALLGE